MQTVFFIPALIATNVAATLTLYCLKYKWCDNPHKSYPDLLLLLVGVFLCWKPLLFENELYLGLFYPEWGLILTLIYGYICIAFVLIFHVLNWCLKQNIVVRCFQIIFLFFAGNLLFLSLCSFIFNDYTRLAEMVAVSATKSTSESSESAGTLLLRERTLSPVGEFTTRIIFPIAGGIIAIVALIFTWQRTSAMMKQTDNMMKQTENSQKQTDNMITQTGNYQKQICIEQFKTAIEHLASEKQAIVLGGVHALHYLAKNSKEYRKQVFEILCSFIREETKTEAYQKRLANTKKPGTASDKSADKCMSFIVTQTIIDKLFREEKGNIYSKFCANLRGADLRKIDLRNAYLKGAKLSKTNLKGVMLHRANLLKARLWRTKLQGAKLRKANLCEVYALKADLQNADLLNADLQGANLQGAKLQDTIISGASFRDVQSSNSSTEIIQSAVQNKTELKTDLSGIRIFDDNKNELQSDEEKRNWFTQKGAIIDPPPSR